MGWETELADVVAGQPIASAWGNQIRDRVVHLIATPAALPTDEPDGGLAYVASDDRLYERWNGQWVWIAGAGRVGYAQVVTAQVGITGAGTDLTGLTVTFTAVLGRAYKLTASADFARSGAATPTNAILQIKHSTGSPIYREVSVATTSNAFAVTVEGTVARTDLSGAITIKLTGVGNGGNVDMGASATRPAFLLVEDIGA